MTDGETTRAGWWARLPVSARAIVAGLLIGLGGANLWPVFLRLFGAPVAAFAELGFLGLYLAWARGRFPPASTRAARIGASRAGRLTAVHWAWGLPAAVAFPIVVHSAIVLLFRLTPFPAAAFHAGYDLSFIPTVPLRWLTCIVSALSAGVCEEVGFRGYMQRPIERRHGATLAILISSLAFMLLHLNKDWSVIGMTPIVLGAGAMLGVLAWASGSLTFCIIGHTIMDIGLFTFWWTQIAGVFDEQPLSRTGIDAPFLIATATFLAAVTVFAHCVRRLAALPGRQAPTNERSKINGPAS